jgi:hypothetical protein
MKNLAKSRWKDDKPLVLWYKERALIERSSNKVRHKRERGKTCERFVKSEHALFVYA